MVNNPERERLLEKANALLTVPGVYLMKDAEGRIIYVGKSKKLKNRVSQYFQNGEKNRKTERMVSAVRGFETIVVSNEAEALTLENELIKLHMPRFNIRLKDAKSYPYLKVTVEDEYPRVLYTRRREADGARYFGPFPDQSAARQLLETVNRIIGLPNCKREFPRDIGRERPCIYRDMRRCIAPCAGDVTPQVYRTVVDEAIAFLSGNSAQVRRLLEEKMTDAAEEERYETAARYRDRIAALDALRQKQKVVGDPSLFLDAIGISHGESATVVTVLSVREGGVAGKEDFVFADDEILEADSMTAFALDYYTLRSIPPVILLSSEESEEDFGACGELLSVKAGHSVKVYAPKRGQKHDLLNIAVNNAEEKLRDFTRKEETVNATLVRLAELCALAVVPDRIEAYDISNYGNEQIFAGMISVVGGKFAKKDYRSFRIDSGKQDDFAAMYETLTRRLNHENSGKSSMPPLPDLLLIDGAEGQVAAARRAVEEAGLSIPVIGMVKDEHHKTRELTDGAQSIGIAREAAVFRLIYGIQEEVHRFAVSRSGGGKRRTLRHSSLESIEGVGAVKAKRLLEYFGGLEGVRRATFAELTASKIGITQAAAVFRHFHPEEEIE